MPPLAGTRRCGAVRDSRSSSFPGEAGRGAWSARRSGPLFRRRKGTMVLPACCRRSLAAVDRRHLDRVPAHVRQPSHSVQDDEAVISYSRRHCRVHRSTRCKKRRESQCDPVGGFASTSWKRLASWVVGLPFLDVRIGKALLASAARLRHSMKGFARKRDE
jgi:hypothetical protein